MRNRLTEIRKANGVSQDKLAFSIGISRQAVYSIEKGKFIPTVATAMKIAGFFGMAVEDIFSLSDGWISACGEAPAEIPPYVFGQGLDKYKELRYGGYPFSFNGGEIAAVYNASLLYGHYVTLENVIKEFEENKLAVLNGFAGTAPNRLGEYFDGHGIRYLKFTPGELAVEMHREKSVAVISYRCKGTLRRMIHTVCAHTEDGLLALFNVNDEDTEKRYVGINEYINKTDIISAYVLNTK